MYNNKLIIIEYQERFTKVGRSTLDRILLRRRKVYLRLGFKDNLEDLIFNLQNVYHLPKSFYNLVCFGLLNNSAIFYKNELKNLYQIISKRVLAQAKRYRNSYLLRLLNSSNNVIYLLKIDANTYQ